MVDTIKPIERLNAAYRDLNSGSVAVVIVEDEVKISELLIEGLPQFDERIVVLHAYERMIPALLGIANKEKPSDDFPSLLGILDELVERDTKTVLLLDHDLPDGNGDELAGKINVKCNVASIGITAHRSNVFGNTEKVMFKPFNLDEMSQAIIGLARVPIKLDHDNGMQPQATAQT